MIKRKNSDVKRHQELLVFGVSISLLLGAIIAVIIVAQPSRPAIVQAYGENCVTSTHADEPSPVYCFDSAADAACYGTLNRVCLPDDASRQEIRDAINAYYDGLHEATPAVPYQVFELDATTPAPATP